MGTDVAPAARTASQGGVEVLVALAVVLGREVVGDVVVTLTSGRGVAVVRDVGGAAAVGLTAGDGARAAVCVTAGGGAEVVPADVVGPCVVGVRPGGLRGVSWRSVGVAGRAEALLVAAPGLKREPGEEVEVVGACGDAEDACIALPGPPVGEGDREGVTETVRKGAGPLSEL